jgi:leader peptidase (prepilin peptidase) / N-methyltransferase
MLVVIAVILLGWVGGMLVNYLADVLPVHLHLTPPFCLACQASQPVINYLFWPRVCSNCGCKRPWRSWVVEGLSIAAALWLWQSPSPRLGFLFGLVVLLYFGLVSVIDLEYRLILFSLSLVGVLLGMCAGVWIQWQRTGQLGLAVGYTLLGGAAGFLIMLLMYSLGGAFARWISRRRGETLEEEALGFGDVHLGLILGLFLGWPVILFGLTAGIIFGGIASLFYLIVKVFTGRHQWFTAIPYGPYLIAGAVFLLYFRDLLATSFPK